MGSEMCIRDRTIHTSEWRDYEADKERQEKGKEKRPICKVQEKMSKKTTATSSERGAGQGCVDGKAQNRRNATTLARGGEAKLYHKKRENEKSHSPLPVRVVEIPRSSATPRGGDRQDEKERNTKNRQSCDIIEWHDYPDTARH